MESWDIRSLEIEPHRPQVLRSDDETRAIAILLPAGEELQEHQVHERAYDFSRFTQRWGNRPAQLVDS